MNQKVFRSVRIPSLLLAAILQCMPMVRAALPAMQSASNLLAIVFRWSAAAAAALGSMQAVSGASTVVTTGDLTATNGVGSTNRLLTAPQTAGWWSATGMPPGINLSGSSTRWYLQGVPTAVGVWNVSLVAKSSATAGASETTSKTITFTVVAGGGSGGGNSPPVANAQSVTTAEDAAKAITLTGTDSNGDVLTYTIVTSPAHGALSGSAPNVTYLPEANYNGTDSFTFKVNDGTVDSAAATVAISINPVNDAPAASTQSVTATEDTARAITLAGSDVDGNALTYTIVTQPAHGALSGAAPNVTYTPVANYNGSDSFTFKVNDGLVDSTTATVAITVSAVNDAPVASAQSVSTPESTAKSITLSGSDVDGDALTYSVVTPPAHGTLGGTAPNLTYTPTANYNGSDSFTFRVNDGSLNSAAATVAITITAVNSTPVASAQNVTTLEDTAKAITLAGTDGDGDSLAFTIVASPSHGVLSGVAPNVTYTPATNYNGSDSFTFKVNDGTVDSTPATVSITVTAVNDAPIANPQSVATDKNVAKAITLSGSDVEGGPLSYSIVAPPGKGVLSGTAPNLTYTPNNNATGADSFAFSVNDGALSSPAATVSITIAAGPNTPPVASAQIVTTAEDTAKAITLSGTDGDGDSLSFTIVASPSHGTLSGSAPNVTYTPAANYNGSDSFTFKVNDGLVDSAPAIVAITVSAVNDAPAASAQSVSTPQDTAKTITLSGSDVDGNALTYSITAPPAHGSLSGTAPNLVYTPTAAYKGADSFAFKVNDGQVDSASAVVSINVTAVNHAPVASAQNVSATEDTARAVTLTGNDADGDPLTFSVTTPPAHGTLTGTAPNLTYTPTANYSGPDSFSFKVGDGTLDSTPAVVSITVSPVNDPPTLNALANVGLTQNAGAQTVALSGISAGPGETQTLVITARSSNPDLIPAPAVNYSSPAANGSLSFTPHADNTGSAIITVTVNDGQSENNTLTRSFTVTVEVANSAISINPIADLTISESAPQQTVMLTGIGTTAQTSGASAPVYTGLTPWLQAMLNRIARPPAASLTVTAASSDTSLIPTPSVVYTSPNSTGTLLFKPVAKASGRATLSVTVADGQNPPVTRSFAVTVNAATNTVPSNIAPTIALTSPAMNAAIGAPATVTLTASVTPNGHTIAKVQFYVGATLVAEEAAAPYSAEWNCESTGSYSLTARALYESNGSVDSAAITVAATDLPAPWVTLDIGGVSVPGSVLVAGNSFAVQGAGTLADAADSFRFVHQALSADGEIWLNLAELPTTGGGARAGIMIRENLSAGARYVFLGKSPDGSLTLQSRASADGTITSQRIAAGTSAAWLRLIRKGNLFVAGYGNKPGSWAIGGLVNITMAPNIYIGMALASGDNGTLATATFSSPTVLP